MKPTKLTGLWAGVLVSLLLISMLSAGPYLGSRDVPLPPEDLRVEHNGAVKEPGETGEYEFEKWTTSFTGPWDETVPIDIYYPTDDSAGPYPAIVVAHGFMMNKEHFVSWGEYYASWGYVASVIHMQYARILNSNHTRCAYEILANLEFLVEMNDDPSSPIEGKVDTEHMGVTGFSVGGKATILAAQFDNQEGRGLVKAIAPMAAALDGQPNVIDYVDDVVVPVLLQSGELDTLIPPDSHSQPFYDALEGVPAQFFVITGGNHNQYGDRNPISGEIGDGNATISRAEQHRIARKYTTSFFNYYFKGQEGYGEYLYGEYADQDVEDEVLVFNQFKDVDYTGPGDTPGTDHNLVTWDASPDDPSTVSHYNIYRSDSQNGIYYHVSTVDADGSPSYDHIDWDRGTADDVWWWYVVRAEGDVEEGNQNAVPEPGHQDTPSVTISFPSGGDVLSARTQEVISWSTQPGASPVDSIDLRYSADGGASWNNIAIGIPDSGSYTWTVPNENSTGCIVHATVRDVEGRTGAGVTPEFTILGIPPLQPGSLSVVHTAVPQAVKNGFFHTDHVPWELTRIVGEGEARWDGEHFEEGGSLYAMVGAEGEGSLYAEESLWEQEIYPVSNEIKVSGVFRKNLFFDSGWRWETFVHHAVLEVLVHDTGAGWQSVFYDDVVTLGDTGWVEFEPVFYEPLGYVDRVRIYMHVEAEGDTGPLDGVRNAMGEMWLDSISLEIQDLEDTEDNLISWDASPEDPGEVSRYDILVSSNWDGPWDTVLTSVPARGRLNYEYVHRGAGTDDGVLWWYVVRAVGQNGLHDGNTYAVQEPGADTVHFEITLGTDPVAWNFVSFNVIPGNPDLVSILEHPVYGISGGYDRVMYYDTSYGWRSHVPGRAGHYNNLDSWDHTMGIWIMVTEDTTLSVEGMLPVSTTLHLEPGWNMVGLPSESPGNHGLPAQVVTIGYFHGAAPYNIAYTHDVADFVFEPGKGYWLFNGADHTVTWTVTY